ncbi:TPA: hypothetical protein IAB29_00515 [Candidatus Ventrenecus stercoripullorum]|nr:hypothetical protein [Candidatus Ventrenecus stercoripullorum]
MNRIYFDTNIFEDIVKKVIDISANELNSFTNVAYYISTAHVEEYFIAIKNDSKNKYTQYNHDRKLLMSSLKIKGILNPSHTRIWNKPEKFDDCLSRVKQFDTTDIMVKKGRKIHQEQSDFFKDLLSSNPDVQNNSNLDFKEIWDKDEVKRALAEFPDYVKTHNTSLFHELKYVYGTHKALEFVPLKKLDPFEIERGCFEEISNKYSLMETIFEFLHSTLNKCGYNRDKKDSTVISGIYDTTHSIYGTYCDYFVSSDDRLRKRISAIYYYLGVPTEVITFNDFLNIADKFK